jgi:hypothetical protein
MRRFGEEIWIADGSPVTAIAGFHYPTRMAVIRLPDDALFIWSPVALTNDLRAKVEALGQPRYIIAPNSLHHMFVGEWLDAFPEAELYAAPGVAEKRPDLAITATLSNDPEPGWDAEIDQVLIAGNALAQEVVFFHRPSGTAIFTDLLQQMPPDWYSGWRRFIARLDGMTGPQPAVPRKFRLAFRSKARARADIARILSWSASRVLMAHGEPVETDAKAYLSKAFGWLGF